MFVSVCAAQIFSIIIITLLGPACLLLLLLARDTNALLLYMPARVLNNLNPHHSVLALSVRHHKSATPRPFLSLSLSLLLQPSLSLSLQGLSIEAS